MSSYSLELLQEKLSRLNSTQESIETLSLWIIRHKQYASTSISTWMEDMRTGDADRRLLLLYLANDVLQNGKRKGADVFMELFQEPLKESMQIISGQKIQTSVERMIRIWKERKIFKHKFVTELISLLEPEKVEPEKKIKMPSSPPKMFQLSLLADAVKEMEKFEGELAVKRANLQALRLNVSDPSTLSQLKDKSSGGRFSEEFEEASQKLQEYCGLLSIEVDERTSILAMILECMEEQKQFHSKVETVLEEHKQLANHVEDFLAKLHERQREVERAQSTSTSDPSAQEDLTEEGDMEIDSGDESSSQVSLQQDSVPTGEPQEQQLPPQEQQQQQPPQQQQLPQLPPPPQQQQMPQQGQHQQKQQQSLQPQQQLSQQQLNAMTHTMQMFPNLLPTIQQQQQQQQPQNSLMMSNPSLQANNLLSVLPTHGADITAATAAVRPSFTPLTVGQQSRNVTPMLQPLPIPMTQPTIAGASMNMSQQLRMPLQSTGQQVAPLPLQRQLDSLQMSINNIQQHQQALFRNNQQHPYGQQHFLNHQQQTIGQQPAFSQQQLQPMPVPVSNQQRPSAPSRRIVVPWSTPGQPPASISTPAVDHTPLFLKAARANAEVNIAPQVTVPLTMPTSELLLTQPSLAPLTTVTASELTYAASLKPLSSQPVMTTSTLISTPVTVVPLTTTAIPVVSETTETSSTQTTLLSSTVTDTNSTPTTTAPSTESQDALALASSLLPGVDTELLQSILQTVKIGSGNKGTTDDSTETLTTTATATTESSKPTTKEQTPPDFDSDDMHVAGPNIVMFGERKRKPSSDETATPAEENLAPDAKLAKVESRPPWLPVEGGAQINGPISSGLADDVQPQADTPPDGKFPTELGFSPKNEWTPSSEQPPYRRDLRPGYSYKLRSQSPLVKDQDLLSFGGDLSPEDFLELLPIVKDYGHGHGPLFMNFGHDEKLSPARDQETPIIIQSPAKDDEFGKDQGPDDDKENPEESSQGQPVVDQIPKDQEMFSENHSPDEAVLPFRDQGFKELPQMTNQPPSIQGRVPSQGLPNRDQESPNRNQVPDQGPVQGHIGDWGPGQELYFNQGPHYQGPGQRPHFRDQIPGQGPPFRVQGPPYRDQGPHFRDQGPGQGPPFREQGPHFRDQGPHYRCQGPYFRDQGPHFRGQGPHFRDQGPYIRDGKGPPYRDHGLPLFRDQGPPMRGQGPPPIRGQGPPIRNQVPHIGDHESGQMMDQRQGLPARSQGSLISNQLLGQGSPDKDLLTAIDLGSGQDLSIQDQALKNFKPSEEVIDSSQDKELDQGQPPRIPGQGPPNNDQPLSQDRDHQELPNNDNTGDDDLNRNSLESRPHSSDQYHFTQVPPPDHYDRPIPDRYYSDRPPWRPPLSAAGPRMSSSPPPPFRHPGPRNVRFPPPRNPHWQHFPPHHYAVHGPPRPSPYRQPY
ncbi:regulation of nuclear pre-mRNA domain-containing protein 2-like isoform X2 [Dysidea avara]|uniref:regulation of nuclear pre-mRNA domain-containing protein 2-like isoform X2 n=1 Tax=Dysidea avara TaxID=196820 RepID=UPI00332C6E70